MEEQRTRATSSFEVNRPVMVSGLYVLSVVSGLTMLVGVILAYIWKDESEDWERRHLEYLIRTFWITLVAWVAGVALLFATIRSALIILPILWIVGVAVWVLVRSIKSLVRAGERRPIS